MKQKAKQQRRVHLARNLPVVAASPAEIVDMYGISKALLYQKLRTGEIPSSKVGTRRIIRIADMEAYLDERRAAS